MHRYPGYRRATAGRHAARHAPAITASSELLGNIPLAPEQIPPDVAQIDDHGVVPAPIATNEIGVIGGTSNHTNGHAIQNVLDLRSIPPPPVSCL
jgi:hypothetical protein